MIAALNSWVLAFDNMSEIKQSLSDAMCRLATGGGFACRKLYTDIDETLIDAMRPQMTDGIEEYASKQDYLDRSLLVMPQPIPEGRRKPEAELWAEFARVHPQILGALLDAVVCALRRRCAITFKRLPRMADFAIWVTAAEEALGWPQGTFLAAYTENRAQADMVALQASVIAGPVWLFARRQWLLSKKPWVGTATTLLAELEKGVDDEEEAERRAHVGTVEGEEECARAQRRDQRVGSHQYRSGRAGEAHLRQGVGGEADAAQHHEDADEAGQERHDRARQERFCMYCCANTAGSITWASTSIRTAASITDARAICRCSAPGRVSPGSR
jgi:hypothetical protein